MYLKCSKSTEGKGEKQCQARLRVHFKMTQIATCGEKEQICPKQMFNINVLNITFPITKQTRLNISNERKGRVSHGCMICLVQNLPMTNKP